MCWYYIRNGHCDGRCGYNNKKRTHPDEEERIYLKNKKYKN